MHSSPAKSGSSLASAISIFVSDSTERACRHHEYAIGYACIQCNKSKKPLEFHGMERSLPRFVQQSPAMLIAGKPVTARSGRTLAVENPATGAVFAQVPSADNADVDAA